VDECRGSGQVPVWSTTRVKFAIGLVVDGREIENQPTSPATGSRSRFMVNSIFCDWSSRQLSTSVWYRSFRKRNIPLPAFGGRALCELLVDERIVWLRSLIVYLRLMLNIGSYSRAFNFSGNKKRDHHSNRTSCAARHENEKSFIGGKLSRPHFPSIGHLCFSRVSSHRRHSFLRLQISPQAY
jgi:hypothetical protein